MQDLKGKFVIPEVTEANFDGSIKLEFSQKIKKPSFENILNNL